MPTLGRRRGRRRRWRQHPDKRLCGVLQLSLCLRGRRRRPRERRAQVDERGLHNGEQLDARRTRILPHRSLGIDHFLLLVRGIQGDQSDNGGFALSFVDYNTIVSLYRVYHVLVDLGWVDFDLGVPPSFPAASAKVPLAQAELGRQWNTQNSSQQTQSTSTWDTLY